MFIFDHLFFFRVGHKWVASCLSLSHYIYHLSLLVRKKTKKHWFHSRVSHRTCLNWTKSERGTGNTEAESVCLGGDVLLYLEPLFARLFSHKQQPLTACCFFLFSSLTPLSPSLTHRHHNTSAAQTYLSLAPTCTNTTHKAFTCTQTTPQHKHHSLLVPSIYLPW